MTGGRYARLGVLQALAVVAGALGSEEPPARPAGSPVPRFVDVAAEAGIDFVHVNGGTTPIVIYEQTAPGAAWIDYDRDGDLDLYLVQSGHRRFPPPPGAERPRNRLFRNDGAGPEGIPRFTDVTDGAGVGDAGYGQGAAVGDVDNDGDDDLFVANHGPDVLYLNRGDGTFEDVTRRTGVTDDLYSTSAAFADVDGDGFLDLFVANYVDFTSGPEFCFYEGIKSGCSDREYRGLPKSLYLNLGPGPDGVPRFREAAKERGVLDPNGRGLGVVFGDLDDDGDQDLYVANDGGANAVFTNDGKGFFRDDTLFSGAGYSEAGMGQAGMGVDAADYDGDGRLDVFVTNFARETNALYHNDGGMLFTYATHAARLAAPSFVPLGWGTQFVDVDLDGDLDLYVANGHVYDVCHLINPQDFFEQQNQLFLNDGRGVFTEVTREAGPGLQIRASSRGAAFGDVDDDGDVDVWVANNGGPGNLLINRTPREGNHALRLSFVGTRSNRNAYGARVIVHVGDRRQTREVKAAGSYLSSNDRRLIVGLGAASKADKVEVRWPSGLVQQFLDVPADVPLAIVEGEPAFRRVGR